MKTIDTPRLILRPIAESDAGDIFDYCRNPDVGPNAGWKPHESIEETHEVMKAVFLGQENVFGMVLKESGKLVGSIGLVPDPKREYERSRMLGYALGEQYWNMGYTTEAVRALVRYGFDEQGFDLISAYCFPFNDRSKRVLEKCGFEYEGRLRKAGQRYDGEILDHECYSLLCTKK